MRVCDFAYLRILRRNHAPKPSDPEPRSVNNGNSDAVCGSLPFFAPVSVLEAAFWSVLLVAAAP